MALKRASPTTTRAGMRVSSVPQKRKERGALLSEAPRSGSDVASRCRRVAYRITTRGVRRVSLSRRPSRRGDRGSRGHDHGDGRDGVRGRSRSPNGHSRTDGRGVRRPAAGARSSGAPRRAAEAARSSGAPRPAQGNGPAARRPEPGPRRRGSLIVPGTNPALAGIMPNRSSAPAAATPPHCPNPDCVFHLDSTGWRFKRAGFLPSKDPPPPNPAVPLFSVPSSLQFTDLLLHLLAPPPRPPRARLPRRSRRLRPPPDRPPIRRRPRHHPAPHRTFGTSLSPAPRDLSKSGPDQARR
jgi:hypothetical protein